MATSTPTNTSQGAPEAFLPTCRLLVIGLGWAAVMFVVLGFWLRSKYGSDAGMIRCNIAFFIGVAAVGLALWQAFTLWFKKETPEEKAVTLTNQRRILSLVLMAAGLGLLLFAVALGLGIKAPSGSYTFIADRFAESFGVLLFGLIAFGSGYLLQQSPKTEEVSPIRFLTEQVPMLKIMQMVLGVVALGTFCTLAYTNRLNNAYFGWLPELAALVALSILCLACLFWLNNSALIDEFGVRLLVLVFGGATGLILFLYSVGRALAWRQDIFLGGIAAWQGEHAWRFWLCAYLQIIALILMFGSFSIARTDIRANVVLRRVMYGYDTIVQALLLVEIIAVLNVVIFALVPFTYDWTKSRGAYAISDRTKHLIGKLKNETHMVVLMSRNDPVYQDVRNLTDNLKPLSPRLQVDYVSPDTDPQEYQKLAMLFPKIIPDSPFASSGRGVLLYVGARPKDEKSAPPHAFVPEKKFVEAAPQMPGSKAKRVFKGEEEIIRELTFLVGDQKKRKIYILQGESEPDINLKRSEPRLKFSQDLSRTGFANLVDKFANRDNLEVAGLSFAKELLKAKGTTPVVHLREEGDKRKEIPDDCETLIVAQGDIPLPFTAIDAIDRYMERGGKMMILLDVVASDDYKKLKSTGLEPLLKRFGVEVLDGFCISVPISVPPRGNPEDIFAVGFESADAPDTHVLARQFAERVVKLPLSARPLRTDPPGRFKAQAVLQMLKSQVSLGFVETDLQVLKEPFFFYLETLDRTNKLVKRVNDDSAIVVAAAVSEVRDTKQGKDEKPRLVVVGDAEFITNSTLASNPSVALTNYSFAISALQWLAEREDIGTRAKETEAYTIPLETNLARMIFVPGWLMLLFTIGLGTGVWIVRRR